MKFSSALFVSFKIYKVRHFFYFQSLHGYYILANRLWQLRQFALSSHLMKKMLLLWCSFSRLQIYEKSAKPMKYLKNRNYHLALTQPAFTCSKLTVETLGQGVKYVTPCSTVSIVNFEHVIITGWALNSPEMNSTCNFSLSKLYSHSLLL